jgi:hypothetical protein
VDHTCADRSGRGHTFQDISSLLMLAARRVRLRRVLLGSLPLVAHVERCARLYKTADPFDRLRQVVASRRLNMPALASPEWGTRSVRAQDAELAKYARGRMLAD